MFVKHLKQFTLFWWWDLLTVRKNFWLISSLPVCSLVVANRTSVLETGELMCFALDLYFFPTIFCLSSPSMPFTLFGTLLFSLQVLVQALRSAWTSRWFRWAGMTLRRFVGGRRRDCRLRRSGSGLHAGGCKVQSLHTKAREIHTLCATIMIWYDIVLFVPCILFTFMCIFSWLETVLFYTEASGLSVCLSVCPPYSITDL